MAWTLEEIQVKRKQVEAKQAAMRTAPSVAAQTAKGSGLALSVTSGDTSPKGRGKTETGTQSASQSASGTGGGWSAEEVRQKRKQVEAKKAAMGLVSADTVGKNVLDGMMESTPSQQRNQPAAELLAALPEGEPSTAEVKTMGTLGSVQRGTSLNAAHEMLESTRTKRKTDPYSELAQKVGESLSARREEEQFDKLNAWMESKEGNRELVGMLRNGKPTSYKLGEHSYTESEAAWLDYAPEELEKLRTSTGGAYSDAELMAMGYTSDQIAAAKQYIAEFDALPAWKRAAQRANDSAEGVASTVASAIPLTGEYLGQSILNTMGTQENLQTLWQGMEGDDRARKLYAYLMSTDADDNAYTDETIQSMGYTPDEIDAMRAKIEGTTVTDGVAPEESLGYQLAQHGQGITELAQRGLSDSGKFWLGAATSAGENLAIAAVNPYAVLPVLTAQTVADSLFESTQSGEDAGKALLRAAAKGGVGWGIEQFGVEQMLEQMGAQGTVSKIAKQLLEKLEDNQLAKSAPHLYQLVSSAGEEALEEFTETYADALVDAVIDGDAESWKKLASSETLAEAAQSALSGAAGGLLISAGAQGMEAFSRNAEKKTPSVSRGADSVPLSVAGATSSPGAGEVFLTEGALSQKREASAHTEDGVHAEDSMPSQLRNQPEAELLAALPKGEPSVEEVTLAGNEKAPADMQAAQEETAINDDPATHTPAQNASIEEYKDSVDVKLAEYVDRVRAGEDLEPYVVSETSDRMRSAMMELTGLDKVGDYTLMDANAVRHITNRHAGGDGSADGTMKSSADVARAAYVLNNFDNAYLATDKADGYFDSKGKRAPIVIFEKKIDGSHIVVEAVTDTKKSRNYIVTEYLSKNGVDNEKVAKPLWSPMSAVADPEVHVRNVATANFATSMEKALRPPMDAVADPRDTSGTLNAVTSAGEPRRTIADPAEGGNRGLPGSSLSAETKTTVQESTGSSSAQNPTPSVTPGGGKVKGESYADLELKADAQSLNTESWNRAEQMDAARQLVRDARMSSAGVQTVVNNMPQGVGAAIYAPAAASLYRLGVVEDVASFDEALRLTGKGGVSGRVQQVLALGETGRKALQIAFLQGKGEAEQYRATKAAELGARPGEQALHEDAGTFTRNGHLSSGKNARDALIELTAKGTGVAAEQKTQLRGNAKGEIQSAIGRVFYRGDADAATVLHETLHEVNSWSNETGQELIDTFHRYLVQQNGMDSVQDLVQGYLDRYERAGQRLSYNQAMEEVTADAMQTIFGTEESFRQFVRLQAAEAKMNAEAQQRTNTVMQKIDTLLKKVLTDIKSFLGLEPDNAAAKAAKTLTEQQLRDLQDLYFAHQIEAGANYRAALEEAGGMEKAAGAQDTAESRFQLHEGKDSLSEQMNDRLDELAEMETVVQVKENTMPFGRSRNENIQNITEYFDSIGNKVTRSGFGVVELGKKGARTTVQHGNSAAKQAAVASIPAVIEKGKQIGYEHNWQGRGYDTYVFAAPVEIDGVKVYEGVIVNTYEHDGRKAFYVHEVCWTDGSYVKFGDDGKLTKKEDTSTQLPKAVLSPLTETQDVSSEKSIAQSQTENKHRYQLDVDEADVAAAREKAVGDGAAQTETVKTVMEMAQAAKVSEENLGALAKKLVKSTDSRADVKTITNRLAALNNYLASGEVDWAVAHSIVLDVAEQVMERSAKRNDALWKQYPDLHKMSMQIQKGSSDYKEILYKYGSWKDATRELARHGVKLTLTKDGAASRWDADFAELQKIGEGFFPSEVPSSAADALEAMAAAHDAIRPTMESAYDTDWDAAKQEIAMQIWGDYLGMPGIANTANAKARGEFAKQTEQLNRQAKEHTIELTMKMKADLAAANARAERAEGAQQRAEDRAAKQKEFAKKQREAVTERVELEKLKGKERLQKARDARENDNTRRAIRKAASQLTKMYEHPNEKQYVPEYLADKIAPVIQLAYDALGDHEAARRIAKSASARYRDASNISDVYGAVEGLRAGVQREMQYDQAVRESWENSGIVEALDDWLTEVNMAREDAMAQIERDIENMNAWVTEDTLEKTAYLDYKNRELNDYKNGGMAKLTSEQLRDLREIVESTLFTIKAENRMIGELEDTMVSDFAEEAAADVNASPGNGLDGSKKGDWRDLGNRFVLERLSWTRQFSRLGGYVSGSRMETLGKMLNDGQYRRNKILLEGEELFSNVLGEKNAKKMAAFAGEGAELVDIGLTDEQKNRVPLNHAQLCNLYMQLHDQGCLYHLMNGGLKVPEPKLWNAGKKKAALQNGVVVKLGQMTDANGDPMADTILQTVEAAMTDFDRAWCADMHKFYNEYTKNLINETSMALYGWELARVPNYFPAAVDKSMIPKEAEGVVYDSTIERRSFTKHRKNSGEMLVLDECQNAVMKSLEGVADYAGMAVPLRNVKKVLNSRVDTKNGMGLFKDGLIREKWGSDTVAALDQLLTDIEAPRKGERSTSLDLKRKLRSNYAGAVLTMNVGVTLSQASGAIASSSVLGSRAGLKAFGQFIQNFDQKKLDALLAEAKEHGDVLVQLRLRGSTGYEMSDIGVKKSRIEQLNDKLAGFKPLDLTFWDEASVAAAWTGAKDYVEHHVEEFADGVVETGSKEYWEAVNEVFRRAVEETQPNNTIMQQAPIQRSTDYMAGELNMFKGQNYQNQGLLFDALEDYKAQAKRYKAEQNTQTKAEVQRAGTKLMRAVGGQAASAAVFALSRVLRDLILRREDRLQDDNGDMTVASVLKAYGLTYLPESLVGCFALGEVAYAAVDNLISGTTYAITSMPGVDSLNDLAEKTFRFVNKLNKDTDAMDEEELKEYHQGLVSYAVSLSCAALETLQGVPAGNIKNLVNAAYRWFDDLKDLKLDFNGAPESAAGQYDRIYDAYLNKDADEAQAALGKLELLGKTDKVYSELKKRLKENEVILEAARKTNSGDWEGRVDIVNEETDALKKLLGDNSSEVRDAVVGAVNAVANQLLIDERGGGKDATVYTAMLDELESGSAKSVQSEIDRLLKAGKTATDVKRKITETMKPEYAAGSDYDRKQIEKLLTALTDGSGNALYTEKTIQKWGEEEEKEEKEDRYDLLK